MLDTLTSLSDLAAVPKCLYDRSALAVQADKLQSSPQARGKEVKKVELSSLERKDG